MNSFRRVLLIGSLGIFSAPNCPSASPHRIGIRSGAGLQQEFYDRNSGETFSPRGANYIRLADQLIGNGTTTDYHSTFNVGAYDAQAAETALANMQRLGFNTIRVFLSVCCLTGLNDGKGGLSAGYLANFADFLTRAKAHNIVVIVTKDWLPQGFGWIPADTSQFQSVNLRLTTAGVAAQVRFWTQFIQQVSTEGPADAILGYEIENEPYFFADQPPLNLLSGKITTANGSTYDMGSAADKQKMLEDGLTYYLNQVRAAILAIDPTALVSVSFWVPSSARGDTVVYPQRVLNDSQLDYNDVHPYVETDPNLGTGVETSSFDQIMQQFGITAPPQGKPLIMSEFGEARIYDESTAARTLENWQMQSCRYGITGSLLWHWQILDQTSLASEPITINGTVENVNSNLVFWTASEPTIGGMLSPVNRPNPCLPGEYPGMDIAFASSVTASNFVPENPPTLAVDGRFNTFWNSGGPPPQWLELDLGMPSSITAVRLTVAQSPSGPTTHRLLGRGPDGDYQLLHTFTGTTQDGDVLTLAPPAPWSGIQFVRIETVQSPSWVAWHEIEILSAGNRSPEITKNGVANSATGLPGVVPGSWVTIFGAQLAASTRSWEIQDFVGGQFPAVLDGVHVAINGKPAPIAYISPSQLNVQAPTDASSGAVNIVVSRDGQQISAVAKTNIVPYAPGLFSYVAGGVSYATAVFPDGAVVGDPVKTSGARPVSAGDHVALFGTGYGPSPASQAIDSPIPLQAPLTISIGGQSTTVGFAGLVGPGLFQFNVVVPPVSSGDQKVETQIAGIQDPGGVYIRVK